MTQPQIFLPQGSSPFPAHGQIEFNRFWSTTARSCFPVGSAPDMNMLGKAFLKYAKSKSWSLDDAKIEKKFRKFCRKRAANKRSHHI